MVVVQKPDFLFSQTLACLVQPMGKLAHSFFAAIVETVHARDHHRVRTESPGFLCNCPGIPFNGTQILMDGHHVKTGFLHQALPVQIAATANRHTGSLCQHANQKTHRMQHKAAQLNAVVPRFPDGGEGFFHRRFIFQY